MRQLNSLFSLLFLLALPLAADEAPKASSPTASAPAASSPTASSPTSSPTVQPQVMHLGVMPAIRAGVGVSASLPDGLPTLCKQAMDANRATRLAAIKSIGYMGPTAVRALPLLKQIMATGDIETRAAVRDALWQIADPSDQTRYFWEMDYRSDLERANIYGPVKHLMVQNLDDQARLDTDYDTMGNRRADVRYDRSGWERARTNYDFDPATGKWSQATLSARTGILTLMMEAYFSPTGDRLREMQYAVDTTPKMSRSYEYDGPRRLVRCEQQTGTAMDTTIFSFTLDDKGKVLRRVIRWGFQGPEESAEMTFDAHGNTLTRRSMVSLPQLDGSVDPGPLKEQPYRDLVKFRFEYAYNDLDEMVTQKMYWGDEVLPERVSTYQYDQWRNVSYVERRDADSNLLNQNHYTWDQWRNETLIDEYDLSGKNSRNERIDFEGMDGWGNWTSRSTWGSGQRTLTNIRTFTYYDCLTCTAALPTPEPTAAPAAAGPAAGTGLTATAGPDNGEGVSPTAQPTPAHKHRRKQPPPVE